MIDYFLESLTNLCSLVGSLDESLNCHQELVEG